MTNIVVVTGGAGFIGSHIVDALLKRNWHVRVVDNFCTGRRENLDPICDQIELIEADINDSPALAAAFQGATAVVHQAALASVPLSIEQPQLVHQVCATGTLNVLFQAHRAGVKRVVYAGSSSCYGDTPVSAKRETDPLFPMSPYAVAKLAGEHYCQSFHHAFGLETVCLRYFNVFGPRQDPHSQYSAVIPLFITRILNQQRPVIFGDGHQSRDFTFVGNVVDANLLALTGPAAQVSGKSFNIADGRATSLLQLLNHLQQLLGMKIEPDFQPARVGDIRDSLADISRATRELSFTPRTSLGDGLKQSIEYYRQVVTV